MVDRHRNRRMVQRAFDVLSGTTSESEDVVPGLALETLGEFVQLAAEQEDLDCDSPAVSRRTLMLVRDFDKRLLTTLRRWCEQNDQWLAPGVEYSEIYEDESGYAVLMTLRGEGVGVWDGRWDHFFRPAALRVAMDSLRRTLVRDLGRWADATGGGVLNDAFGRDALACSDDPGRELDKEESEDEEQRDREERELDAGLVRDINGLDGRRKPRR